MKNIWIIIAVVVVVLIGFFLLGGNQTQAPVTSTPGGEAESDLGEVMEKTIILAEQNDSGESGTAVLREENGQVRVTLNMAGAEVGVEQPAHIHAGQCPDVGGVSYPLTNVVDGESVTTLDVTLEQLAAQLPLAINVHKSVTEASVYTSCGDLDL